MRIARQLRIAKGLTLRDVEQMIECDHSAIANFELGETLLREPALKAYAKLLGVTIDELIRSEGEAPSTGSGQAPAVA